VLQIVVCDDGPIGTRLVTHPAVDTVVLTGSFQTATAFLDAQADMRLFAETSGKNAIVITPSADLDQAIADLVRSAFGHAGQKCSAASLGIVVGELYDDPAFRVRLREAVRSIRVGPATEPATMMGPLIQAPGGPLRRALTTLDAGESWLLEPAPIGADLSGRLWTPGVRLDVVGGSWFHQTECFGPVLGLMRARDLDHAITLQNGTPFGLTGGIHTLDTAEIERWLGQVEVGNAYVNRHITGAIVRRQPFGGWKRSTVGGGAKPGGPGHVAQFTRVVDPTLDPDAARRSFGRAAIDVVHAEHDPSALAAESNVLRCCPLRRVAVRYLRAQATEIAVIEAAAEVAGTDLLASTTEDESDREFAARCVEAAVDRVRLLCALDDDGRRMLHRSDIVIDDTPPVGEGALELRHWVREQSVSRTTHRHGRTTA
jgi:RHH-type transcriptional regulator, proline utilization regulon repressor / proline dehydrogenase / delta 1-pyrroline-5-carboxylate dehydrogenase